MTKVELEFTPERPDDEVKMAIHFAHDANDAALYRKLKAQKSSVFEAVNGSCNRDGPRTTKGSAEIFPPI